VVDHIHHQKEMGEAGQARRGGGSKVSHNKTHGLAECPVKGDGEICYGAQVSHRVIYLVVIWVLGWIVSPLLNSINLKYSVLIKPKILDL
jgi:hypothetical protein